MQAELKNAKKDYEKEVQETTGKTEQDLQRVQEAVVDPRRNNEALASSTKVAESKEEKEQTSEEVSKQLETQLKQLAKNKKIDFPWTDNAWKCSRPEKRLAISSAKVFQQLLEK